MFETSIDIGLPAAPAVVFDHLTDPELLVRWWPTTAETDPRPGGVYCLHWAGPGVTLRGVYRDVDRPHRLAYSWSWDHEDATDEVVVELAPVDGGARLRLRHSAQSGEAEDEHREGWEFFLGRLRELLAGSDR